LTPVSALIAVTGVAVSVLVTIGAAGEDLPPTLVTSGAGIHLRSSHLVVLTTHEVGS